MIFRYPYPILHVMTETTNSGPPAGAGGKSTDAYIPSGDTGRTTDSEAARLASLISQKNTLSHHDLCDLDTVVAENLRRSERNVARAQLRADPDYIEEPSDDEEFLEEPASEPSTPFAQTAVGKKMMKAAAYLKTLTPSTRQIMSRLGGEAFGGVSADLEPNPIPDVTAGGSSSEQEPKIFTGSNTTLASGTDGLFEIPRPLLNLAKAKVHIPLTLLTNAALRKMHEDPSCVKLKKGLVLNDPKMIVMDTSNGFPHESTITADVFFEAQSNFLKLLNLIADDVVVARFKGHRKFCMSRDEYTSNFPAVLRFDTETRRRFFNTSIFLDPDTYRERWSEVKIDARMDRDRGNTGGARFNPYPPRKPDAPSGAGSSSDGKPFRRGKGETSTDHLLCVICGRTGHKSSGCTHTQTCKGTAPVCMSQDNKIVLRTTKEVVCIAYNLGRCPARHGPEILHVCSQCGSSTHGVAAKSC